MSGRQSLTRPETTSSRSGNGASRARAIATADPAAQSVSAACAKGEAGSWPWLWRRSPVHPPLPEPRPLILLSRKIMFDGRTRSDAPTPSLPPVPAMKAADFERAFEQALARLLSPAQMRERLAAERLRMFRQRWPEQSIAV